jgi:predicted transcriptional regulator of viral defense system
MIVLADPIDLDTLRLREEFVSMPGLSVTAAQAARLLSVRLDHARDILGTLERERFLTRAADGVYRRSIVPTVGRSVDCGRYL